MPKGQWEWKDVEEFDERIGDPLYFDGTHTRFRPDPGWPALRLADDIGFPLHRSA